MIKIGVVGIPGGWSTQRLLDRVEEITGFRCLIDIEMVVCDLTEGTAYYKDIDLFQLDALIIKKIGASYSPDLLDRLEVLRFMSEKGLKIFSSPINILRVLDRLSCTITLQSAGLPMPPTTITANVQQAIETVHRYEEAVFKPLYSSKAKGMRLIKSAKECISQVENFKAKNPTMYIQKRIDHHGKDLGITFLNGKYLTTYARCAKGQSWNTTTRSGGQYEPFEPAAEIIEMAHKAQSLFGLSFTCVDVALTDEGPVIFEVSAFGGFKGVETASGIDVAARYVDHVLDEINR